MNSSNFFVRSITLIVAGLMFISSIGKTSSGASLAVAAQPEATWVIETIPNSEHYASFDFALDASGYGRIATSVGSGVMWEPPLIYLEQTATGWVSQTLDTAPDYFGGISLALDELDLPHLSYNNYSTLFEKPVYLYHDLFQWQVEMVGEPKDAAAETSLALDSNGQPAISYYQSKDYILKFAYRDLNGWQLETVDNSYQAGNINRLAISQNNEPHIIYSYYDSGSMGTRFKHAVKTAGGWQITPLNLGNTPAYLDFCLDSAGFPHVQTINCIGDNHLNKSLGCY